MKIIFFGTPEYVIPILDLLNKTYELVAVVTQEPKPAGRDQKLMYSAVDTWAFKRKIPKQFDFENLPEASLGICAAFGVIIPSEVLNHFKYGILNIHPSLLPKYRGASPIQTAIANGDSETGVTIIKMDTMMDHGKIVSQFKEEIRSDDTFESLRDRLFKLSSEVLINLIPAYIKQKINLKEQNHDSATFTKIISKNDGYVDLERDAPKVVERKFRAYTPWPGIHTKVKIGDGENEIEKRLKIISCHLDHSTGNLILDTVQLEGKNPVNFKQFNEAYKVF